MRSRISAARGGSDTKGRRAFCDALVTRVSNENGSRSPSFDEAPDFLADCPAAKTHGGIAAADAVVSSVLRTCRREGVRVMRGRNFYRGRWISAALLAGPLCKGDGSFPSRPHSFGSQDNKLGRSGVLTRRVGLLLLALLSLRVPRGQLFYWLRSIAFWSL